MAKKILFSFLFLLFASLSYSNPININEDTTQIYIGTNIQYIKDTTGLLTFSKIQKMTNWSQIKHNYFNKGFDKNTYWLKFTIKNPAKKKLFLKTGYQKFYNIVFFQPDEKGLYHSMETGLKFPFKHRPLQDLFFNFPVSSLAYGTYYLKIKTKIFPMQIQPKLLTEEYYRIYKTNRAWFFFLYILAMGLLLIFSLYYFLLTKEKGFLIQIFYILSWILFQITFWGYGFKHFWPQSGIFDSYILIVSIFFIGILTALLYKYFLNLQKDFPKLNKDITYFILYPTLISFVLILILPQNVTLQLALIIALYIIVAEFILGIRLLQKKSSLALFLFIGFLGTQIGSGLGAISYSYSIHSNFAKWSLLFGNLWIILFLFLALAYKYQNFKRKLKQKEKEIQLAYFSLEHSSEYYLRVQETGYFSYANKAICQDLQYSFDEICQLNPWNIIKGLTKEKWKELRENLKINKYLNKEFVLTRKDGTEINVIVSANYLEYENEGYTFVFMHDISERKEFENELIKKEKKLSITLNSIGDAVIVTDTKSRIMRMNPIAEKLTGWTFKDAVTLSLEKVFHIINRDSNKKVESPVKKVIKSGRIIGLANHTILISKDNNRYHISDSGAPIINENGKIIGVILVFRDVTQEYNLQVQLQHSQTLEALGQLAGGIAHDFNNILAGILSNAELAKTEENLSPSKKSTNDTIIELCERGSDISQKLLLLSRKNELNMKDINITAIILDVIDILQHSIEKKINIKANFDPKKQHYILGDQTQIQSSLLNVALNARDAIKEKGTITFDIQEEYLDENFCKNHIIENTPGSYIEISISDTGYGINKENIQKIFQPFFTTKEVGKGTGLGLSLAYTTMKDHHGGITVYSEPNKGTTFHLYFKLINPTKAETSKEIIEYGSGHILIIDDEKMLRDILDTLMQKLGYSSTTMGLPDDAINYYKKEYQNIDLVLIDYIMPDKNGLETFQILKEINPNIKTIMMSGFSQNLKQDDIKKEGIKDFISKPFKIAKLSKIIKDVLSE